MAETFHPGTTGLRVARSELILGGQRSGKSRRAELLAREWLAQAPQHQALMLATAQAHDDEMRERIRRHQADRAERVPGMRTLEVPSDLPAAIEAHSHVHTLLVVDCLTLWLTQNLMPHQPSPGPGHGWGDANDPRFQPRTTALPSLDDPQDPLTLVHALQRARGPVVLVSNEIGLGVIPLGREVRAFVDALGRLNQAVAQVCSRVTLMAAGLPLNLKEAA